MRIGPPGTRRERGDALACLLGDESNDSERVREALSLADAGDIDLRGLLAAWKGGRVVAAALACAAPDGSAYVWPPVLRAAARPQDALDLLHELVDRADRAGCPFLQAVLDTDRPDHHAALEAVGFHLLTELLYLQRPLSHPPPAIVATAGRSVAFSERSAARFANVIERTYAGSQDCPAFAGLRSAAEALRSYEAAGDFTPHQWRLIECGGRDVAVALVNDRHEERSREIVYLGVVPETRRSGIARNVVLEILHEAWADRCEAVLAAADATNLPAVNLYSRLGFSPASRQAVFLRRRPA